MKFMESGEPSSHGTLTIQQLKSRSNEFDVESIHTLNLSQLSLCNLSMIGCCTGMERLNLSHNDINQLHPLSSLASLQSLDLSANRITSLNGLQSLEKLERLNLAGNLLGSVDVLKALVPVHSLRHLRLHDMLKDMSNPVCMRQSYKEDIVNLLPRLESLDGEILKGPGSQVFNLMSEMEKELVTGKSSPRRGGPIRTVSSPPPLPAGLFSIERNSDVGEASIVEQQFRNGVEMCEALNNRSAQLIAQAEQKLKTREKV